MTIWKEIKEQCLLGPCPTFYNLKGLIKSKEEWRLRKLMLILLMKCIIMQTNRASLPSLRMTGLMVIFKRRPIKKCNEIKVPVRFLMVVFNLRDNRKLVYRILVNRATCPNQLKEESSKDLASQITNQFLLVSRNQASKLTWILKVCRMITTNRHSITKANLPSLPEESKEWQGPRLFWIRLKPQGKDWLLLTQ